MSEMFEVEMVDTKDELLDYAFDFLVEEEKTLFITEYDTALDIASELEELLEVSVVDRVDCDSELQDIVYIKRIDEDIFVIGNVFTEEGDINFLESDFVLVQDKLLLDDIIDDFIYAEEELEIIGYEEDIDEEFNPCENCERCCCECEESAYDLLDEAQQEYIENISKNFDYDKDILAELYGVAFNDGSKYSLASLGKQLSEITEE